MSFSVEPQAIALDEMPAARRSAQLYDRTLPAARWYAIAVLAVALTTVALAGWELRMRELGLRTADSGDGYSYWSVERRKVDEVSANGIVIIGDSRILLDSNLDEWERVSGIRPIQLATVGTSALPFLRDLARDQRFRGLVVVGMSELLYFTGNANQAPPVIAFTRDETPSQRVGHLLQLQLERNLAFMDPMYTPFSMLETLPVPERPGVAKLALGIGYGKLYESLPGRASSMWGPLASDPERQKIARDVWLSPTFYRAPPEHLRPLPGFLFRQAISESQADVEQIRSRGGDVAFVDPPYADRLLAVGGRLTPRSQGWDPLLAATGSYGFHFEDFPQVKGLPLPDSSHLDPASARTFTRIYVEALCRNVAWLRQHASRCQ